jgi:hypothetical protein
LAKLYLASQSFTDLLLRLLLSGGSRWVAQRPQLVRVVALPVRGGQVKLVPVHVKDGAGELRVAGELAAEGVRGAAVEHVAAVLVTVDSHVAQRGGAAQVQAPGQAPHLFRKKG